MKVTADHPVTQPAPGTAADLAGVRAPDLILTPEEAVEMRSLLEHALADRGLPRPVSALPDRDRVHAICQAARQADCGYCCAFPGEPCAYSGTGPDGYHVARFAVATRQELITSEDLLAIFDAAGVFTSTTVVYDEA